MTGKSGAGRAVVHRHGLLLLLTVVALACTSQPKPTAAPGPSPSPSPTAADSTSPPSTPTGTPPALATPTPRPTAPPKSVADLALEMCDPEGLVACEHQAAVMSEPVLGSGVSLTYSTEWADGRLDRPTWSAAALGLGGWSFDVLERYDPTNKVLIGGEGSWRIVDPVALADGTHAIPTFDGLRYFVFDQQWRQLRTADGATGATLLTFSYDDAGRLSGIDGQLDNSAVRLSIVRADDGDVRDLLGLKDTATHLLIDGSDGMLAEIIRPDNRTYQVTNGKFGLITAWQESGRGAVAFTYDDAGRVASATDADGVARQFTFAGSAGAATVTTTWSGGATSSIRSERTGDVLQRTFTDTDGTKTKLAVTADGSTTLTRPDGTVITAGSVAHSRWGMAAPVRTPYVETRPEGTTYRVETATTMGTGVAEPAGGPWHTDYTVNGQRYVDSFDPTSHTVSRTDPGGLKSDTVFDAAGRVVRRTDPGAPPTTYAYDQLGRLASAVVGSGPDAMSTSYAYDDTTGSVTVTNPDGSTSAMVFDATGNQLTSSSTGESVAFQRDGSGNPLQVRLGNHPATSIGYSPAGRQTGYITPVVGNDQSYETTSYGPDGQPTQISGPGDRSIAFTYDAAGHPTQWQFDAGSVTASYSAQTGLLDKLQTSDAVTTSFTYAGDQPVGLGWSGPIGGGVTQTLDALLRIVSEAVSGSDPFAYGYDASGALDSIGSMTIERAATSGLPTAATDGAVHVAREFDDMGRLSRVTTTANGTTVLDESYTRDIYGRLKGIQRVDSAGKSSSLAYTYDDSGRITGFSVDGSQATYTYDEAGNRISATTGSSPTSSAFDERDRLVSMGETAYSYQPDGTLLTRTAGGTTSTYNFDDFGVLRLAQLPDHRVSYIVDGGGRRIGRVVDGTPVAGYLYNVDDQIVGLTDGTSNVVATFAYDDLGNLALVRRDGHEYVVVTDQVGSPTLLVDAQSGKVAEQVEYDAWGNVLNDTNPGLTPFGFAGGLFDTDTGFVHFGARDYDSQSGRWLEPDPIRYQGGDPNLYRYVVDDPVNASDPSGLIKPAGSAGTAKGTPSRPGGPGGGVGKGGPKGTGGAGKGVGKGADKGTPPTKQSPYRPPPDQQTPDKNPPPPAAPPSQPPPQKAPPDGPVSICFIGCLPAEPGGVGSPTLYAPGGCDFGVCAGGICLLICAGGNGNGDDWFCTMLCVYGDPHERTADGLEIDFQAAGEFVVARSADSSLELQARFEVPGAHTSVTRTTALAMKVGTDTVAFYADQSRPLIVNGQVVTRSDYSARLPAGGTVERHGTQSTVTWPDGTKLTVHSYTYFMNYTFTASPAVAATMVGLAGGHDSNPDNDLTARDGTVVHKGAPDFFDQLYHTWGDSWRLSQSELLFDYLPTETTDTFTRSDIPSGPVAAADLDADARAQAEDICRAMGATDDPTLSNCILDVGETGDPTYAASAGTVAASASTVAAPVVVGQTQSLTLDTPTTGEISKVGESDTFTFSLSAAQTIYVDSQGDCGGTQIRWQLVDASGNLVPSPAGTATSSAACFDLGQFDLQPGDYAVQISSTSITGAYAFEVWQVATKDFDITLNQQVSAGVPAAGAGEISTKGETDDYHLALPEPHIVYLDAQGDCGGTYIRWHLVDAAGKTVLADDGTNDSALCFNLGRYSLPAGEYTVHVAATDGLGPYGFVVWDVPPTQTFDLALDQVVASGQPADGAGEIKVPGESDRYSFSLGGDQTVYLIANGDCGGTYIRWQLLDSVGKVVAANDGTSNVATCFDLGAFSLTAGTYTVEVYTSDHIGPYSIVVSSVPPPT